MKENEGDGIMKATMQARLIGQIYHHACKEYLRQKGVPGQAIKKIRKEYLTVRARAKDIGAKNMTGSYVMGIYFIALNRESGLSAEDNYDVFYQGIAHSKMIKSSLGDAESYLSEKRLPGRLKWAEESHKKQYENDWVLDVLPGNGAYDLGYDYHECGIVKICRDEGCAELASYLCRLDYLLADLMGLTLKREGTLADGADKCDFRYSRK